MTSLRHTAEDICASTTQSDSSNSGTEQNSVDLDDDWLDSFSRYAENASSERLRVIFGKVLAGEIRRTGSYSLFTLDFLSKIGQKEADMITTLAPFVMNNNVVMTDRTKSVLNIHLSLVLSCYGIIATPAAEPTLTVFSLKTGPFELFENHETLHKSIAIMKNKDKFLIVVTESIKTITYPCIVLSPVGGEILGLHASDVDPIMLSELASHLKSQGADLYIGDIPQAENGSASPMAGRELLSNSSVTIHLVSPSVKKVKQKRQRR